MVWEMSIYGVFVISRSAIAMGYRSLLLPLVQKSKAI